MLKNLIIIIMLSFIPWITFAQTDYEKDKADYYVSEQQINEELEQINLIMCFMKNTSPNAFVNTDPYSAQIYEDECKIKADKSSDSTKAQPKSASSASSSSSSQQQNNAQKKATNSIIKVNRASETSAVTSNVWVFLTDEEIQIPSPANPNQLLAIDKMTVYGHMTQTAAATDENPKGNFEFVYNYVLDKEDTQTAENMEMGKGYLKAEAGTVIMKESSYGEDINLKAVFSTDTENKFSGIYSILLSSDNEDTGEGDGPPGEDTGGGTTPSQRISLNTESSEEQSGSSGSSSQEGSNQQTGYILYNQFQNNPVTNVFCEQTIAVDSISMLSQANSNGEYVTKTAITDLSTLPSSISTTKKCYSTNKTNAKKNIWRYGVYNEDGSRASITNPSFPIKSEVTDVSTATTYPVYGWASYYGVHVDTFNLPANTDVTSLTFKKEQFGNSNEVDTKTYTLQAINARVEKIEAKQIALESLDKISIAMYVGDTYFQNEYNNLNTAFEMNKEYLGTYSKTNNSFTFTDLIDFSQGYTKTSITPITFTATEWINAMTKDKNEDWAWTKTLGVWSSETSTWYEISKESMNAPADKLLRVEKNSFIDPTTLPENTELVCIQDCITSTGLTNTYTEVSSKISNKSSDYKVSVSPYNSTPSLYDTNSNWIGAVADTDLITYSFNTTGAIIDSVSNLTMSIPSSILTLTDQSELGNYYFEHPIYQYQNPVGYGVSTGELVNKNDLDKLECKKESDGTYIEDSQDNLKTAKNSTKIYCEQELRSTINVRYRIMFETWTNYKLIDDTNQTVVFDAPKMLELVVPNDSSIDSQYHGKTYQLNFEDFDQLHGVPGYVLDTATGENKGEFFAGQWQDSYRYINAFTIPDGTEIHDNTTDPVTKYKVKALDGEEFLTPATLEDFTETYSKSDLPTNSVFKDISSKDSADFIGDKPTNLLCSGKTLVVHGNVSYSPNGTGTQCPE